MTTVIYVHGAGNKPPNADLKRNWDLDLFGADMGDHTRMVYYADLLHAAPGVIGVDDCTQEQALATLINGTDSVEASLVPALSEPGSEFALRLSIDMTAAATSRSTIPSVLPLPPALRRLVLRQLLRRFIPDADAYFFGAQREAIRRRMRDAIADADDQVVVVSHSLGTVVAYDVLSEPPFAGLSVPVFVTLGSPLGYTEIQGVISKPLRVPPEVRMWANFADPLDVVTLDTTLSRDFGASPRIIDAVVDNPSPTNHAACGYLRAPRVRAVVNAALLQPV